MAKYFRFPFAENGDRQEVPDENAGGFVNYGDGYGVRYELPKTNPDRLNIDRAPYNQVLNDVTANLKQWQDNGFPEFVADDGTGSPLSYEAGRTVSDGGILYLANTQTTAAPPSSEWVTLGSPEDILRYQPGPVSVDVSGGTDVTLTGIAAFAKDINLTGTITADIAVIVPDTARKYTIVNSTSGAFTVTVKTATGTGVVVPQGQARVLRSDGVDVVFGAPSDTVSSEALAGSAQILQTFTSPDRIENSTYTNTSGRPIYVSIVARCATGARGGVDLTVGGETVDRAQNEISGTAAFMTVSYIIQDGSSYSVNLTDAGTEIVLWSEVR